MSGAKVVGGDTHNGGKCIVTVGCEKWSPAKAQRRKDESCCVVFLRAQRCGVKVSCKDTFLYLGCIFV